VWRATALANYKWNDNLSTSMGVRFSGDQFTTLDNSDINGFAYTASSKYLILDLRARYKFNKNIVMALGVDNLTDQEYWNFHPYPRRTWVAEMKYDF
jgi:iron complex outermembrane receptor protein